MRERQAEARASVEASGRDWGRQAVFISEEVEMAGGLRAAGQSPTKIVAQLGCSRTTFYRVRQGELARERVCGRKVARLPSHMPRPSPRP